MESNSGGGILDMKVVTGSRMWLKIPFSVLLLIIIFFLYQWISSPMILSVIGTGSVSVPADYATITLTLTSSGNNASESTSQIKTKLENIKKDIANYGVRENEIFESQVTTYPASTLVAGAAGFQSTATVSFKTVQINNIDSIVVNMYAQGAVLVSQPTLSVNDPNGLEKQAYDKAVKDAKAKASQIAISNFKFIKKIVLVEQSTNEPTSTVTSKVDSIENLSGDINPEAGVMKIVKAVSVSYKMW